MADKATIIAAIRTHYEKLGISLDALSDAEIEMGVRQLADAMKGSGAGEEQVLAAMRKAVVIAKKNAAARQAALDAGAVDASSGKAG